MVTWPWFELWPLFAVDKRDVCPEGWVQHRDSCFYNKLDEHTWYGAAVHCYFHNGAHPTHIDDAEEYVSITNKTGRPLNTGVSFALNHFRQYIIIGLKPSVANKLCKTCTKSSKNFEKNSEFVIENGTKLIFLLVKCEKVNQKKRKKLDTSKIRAPYESLKLHMSRPLYPFRRIRVCLEGKRSGCNSLTIWLTKSDYWN